MDILLAVLGLVRRANIEKPIEGAAGIARVTKAVVGSGEVCDRGRDPRLVGQTTIVLCARSRVQIVALWSPWRTENDQRG